MFSFASTSNPWDTSASYRVSTNNMSSEMANMSSTHSDSSNYSDVFANIKNFIATVERNLNDIGLGRSSGDSLTPRVVSRQVIPNRADLIVIGRFPISDTVIDLCTPEAPNRVEGFINLVDSYKPPVRVNRRGAHRPIVQGDDAESIDLTESPPKRSCNTARDNANTSVSEDLYKCPVCFESVRQREPCTTRCGHVFCKECIEGAVRSTRKCPLCRKKIGIRQLQRVYL